MATPPRSLLLLPEAARLRHRRRTSGPRRLESFDGNDNKNENEDRDENEHEHGKDEKGLLTCRPGRTDDGGNHNGRETVNIGGMLLVAINDGMNGMQLQIRLCGELARNQNSALTHC